MKKVNVLFIIDTMSYAGAQNHVAQLANGLDKSQYSVHICCLKEVGELGEELALFGVTIFPLHLKKLFGPRAIMATFMLARWLRSHSIDIVHTFLFASHVFGTISARLARVPVVIAGIRGEAVTWERLGHRVAKIVADRYVDLFLPNSEYLKKILIERDGIGDERISVVRNGVSLARFSPAVSPGAVRADLSLRRDERIVGCVANLLPVKGVDTFLEAAGIVTRHKKKVRFFIVGAERPSAGGDFRKVLERICDDPHLKGRVEFLGTRKDMPQVYAAMDLLVLPSRSEGMSNTLLEAMAMSLPIVASDIEANREVVVEGENAFLFPVGEASVLAQKIEVILEEPGLAKRLGEASRRIAEENFSLGRMISDINSVYRGALAEKDVVMRYFEKKARQFDAIYSGKKSPPGRLLDRLLRWDMFERRNIVLAVAAEIEARNILDVGCGSGRIAIPLARETSARIVGIDTSPRMIDMARSAAGAAGVLERCTFKEGDIFSLPLEEKFDMVVAMGFFDYIFDPLPILERMALLTEGEVVASFPMRNLRAFIRKIRLKICGCPVRFYSSKEVRELFSRAGMDIIDLKSVGNLYVVRSKKI